MTTCAPLGAWSTASMMPQGWAWEHTVPVPSGAAYRVVAAWAEGTGLTAATAARTVTTTIWFRMLCHATQVAAQKSVAWTRGSIHLLHAQRPQGARRQGHPRQRDAVVPAWREDRRGRAERRRQVQRAEDHGRPGHRIERR